MYVNVGAGMNSEKKRNKDKKNKRHSGETVWEVAFDDEDDSMSNYSFDPRPFTGGEKSQSVSPERPDGGGKSIGDMGKPTREPSQGSNVLERNMSTRRNPGDFSVGSSGKFYLKMKKMTTARRKRRQSSLVSAEERPSMIQRVMNKVHPSMNNMDPGIQTFPEKAEPLELVDDGTHTTRIKNRVRRGSLVFMNFRSRIWMLVDDPSSSQAAMNIAVIIMFLIVVSCTTFVLETVPSLNPEDNAGSKVYFDIVEYLACGVFTVEYVTRFLSCPNVFIFIIEPFNVVDLVAILPFYLQLFLSDVGSGLVVLRVIRLMRVVRVLKLSKYSTGMQIFITALRNSGQALGMLTFFSMIGCVLFSSIMYFVENDGNEEMFPSIPASFWWCIVTMTTVGYGDAFPKSSLGQFIAAITMYAGLLMLTLPMSVIGGNFSAAMEEHEEAKKRAEGGGDSDADSTDDDPEEAAEMLRQMRTLDNSHQQSSVTQRRKYANADLPNHVKDLHSNISSMDSLKDNQDDLRRLAVIKATNSNRNSSHTNAGGPVTENNCTPGTTRSYGEDASLPEGMDPSTLPKKLILKELAALQHRLGGIGDEVRNMENTITRLASIVHGLPPAALSRPQSRPQSRANTVSAFERLPEPIVNDIK